MDEFVADLHFHVSTKLSINSTVYLSSSVYVEDGGSDGAVIWIGCSARRTHCHFLHLN